MKNVFILFFVLITSLSAQVKITGLIINSETNQPISFANVLVKDTDIHSSSNESGEFTLEGKINSNSQLLFSQVGFESRSIDISDLALNNNRIILKPKLFSSQTILVKGSIAQQGITPISFSKVEAKEITKIYSTQDIPEMLSNLPSVTSYSESGNGIGYNYISIRGFDQRRISVSINGIPQNEPEDHNVYWLDFPDLLENTDLIQLQRGAGSAIAGYPAIGGAINIITSSFSEKPKLEYSTSLGSYNTRKYSALYSSGLLEGKYSFSAKLSQTLSSGYRNSSWVDYKSYYLSVIRFDRNFTTQVNIYGGPIADGLAYTGLPKFAIKDRSLRKENYSYWESDGKNYSYTLTRRPEEIENFFQPHFELLNEYEINKNISVNSALFLIIGNGFFDYDASWADTSYFRLTKENGFNAITNPGNALIRAMVNNKQWGWLPRISIKHADGELLIGSEFRFHNSIHWGSVTFADNLPAGIQKDFRYYEYKGGNTIMNFFINENYQMDENLNVMIETQLAYHKYKLFNEKFINTSLEVSNLFFNSRIGVNYKFTPAFNSYFTFSRVSREPRLVNYYDAAESSGGATPQFELLPNGQYDFNNPLVKPETMNNFELGSSFTKGNFSSSINLYYMLFSNEIVKKGQLDRFGQPITGNMDRTIHYGIEANFVYKLNRNLEFIVNGSASINKISSGGVYVYTEGPNDAPIYIKVNLEGNSISGFPSSTANAIIRYDDNNLFAQLSAKYVGSYYSDNYSEKLGDLLKFYPYLTSYNDNQVDSYFVANLYLSYELNLEPAFKNVKAFVQINNLFDNLYAANGIGGEYFPAAERNMLFGVKLGF